MNTETEKLAGTQSVTVRASGRPVPDQSEPGKVCELLPGMPWCPNCAEKNTRIQQLLERNNIDLELRREAERTVKIRDAQIEAQARLIGEWIDRSEGYEEALRLTEKHKTPAPVVDAAKHQPFKYDPTDPEVKTKRRIYVASSWRNSIQQPVVRELRAAGHEVYDFRNPAPDNHGFAWSEVNPDWLQWSPAEFVKDLYSGHPAVTRGFAFDKSGLDWCDTCVLVLPCGRSAHLEAGYCAGKGKQTLFYLSPDRFEPELMYLLGDGCFTKLADLVAALEAPRG